MSLLTLGQANVSKTYSGAHRTRQNVRASSSTDSVAPGGTAIVSVISAPGLVGSLNLRVTTNVSASRCAGRHHPCGDHQPEGLSLHRRIDRLPDVLTAGAESIYPSLRSGCGSEGPPAPRRRTEDPWVVPAGGADRWASHAQCHPPAPRGTWVTMPISTCGRELDRVPFAAELDPAVPVEISPAIGCLTAQAIEKRIVVPGIVVDEHEPLNPAPAGEEERGRKARVAPATAVGVLALRKLAIVEQQRGAGGQPVSGEPARVDGGDLMTERGFVIGQVADARRALAKAEPERWPPVGGPARPSTQPDRCSRAPRGSPER